MISIRDAKAPAPALHGGGGDFLRAKQKRTASSSRMLYELARRYDEWPGEAYEGLLRGGAIKAWAKHGVCLRSSWQDDKHGITHMSDAIIQQAMATPGGAYYRIRPKRARHAHGSSETAFLRTLMVHSAGPIGRQPRATSGAGQLRARGAQDRLKLPVIKRSGSRRRPRHRPGGYSRRLHHPEFLGAGWGAGALRCCPTRTS